MKEVDHRVQNSLQLVSAFLSLQARDAGPGPVADQLIEARSRLSAVALVHRRLYRDDQIETIDLARYLEELIGDLKASLGDEWGSKMMVDLTPMLIPTDRAVNIGLIAAELVINATKYAYPGGSGPIDIVLEQHRNRLRLIVADHGGGIAGQRSGFGSRMMGAVMARLGGEMEQTDNRPGLRVIVTAPIEEKPR
jgi:two-component sensor histidine kinase